MTKTLTEQWKDDPDEILSPDEEVIHEQNKIIERLQEQLEKKDKLIEKLKKDKKDCKRCAFNCFHQMQSGV